MIGSVRLLIVDHDPRSREGLTAALRETGFSCESCTSAPEALHRMCGQPYNLIIANTSLPGLVILDLPCSPLDGCSLLLVSFRQGRIPAAWLGLSQPVSPRMLRSALGYLLENSREMDAAPYLDQATILAHEFSSPLSSLKTTAETLSQGYYGPLSDKQQSAVECIMRNCSYLEDTLACISDWQQLESGTLEDSKQAVPLVKAVITPVLARPEYRSNTKAMTFSVDVGEDVQVAGDAKLLGIVLNNLINNAIKYGRLGTEIQIRASRTDQKQLTLSVRNLGVGIPAADMGRLFQRFERLRQPGTEGIKGSGLGLYLCRRIVESLGGSISARSEPGEYAEFRVSLNLA